MKLPSKTSKIKPNENSIKNETSPVITGDSVNQRNQTSEWRGAGTHLADTPSKKRHSLIVNVFNKLLKSFNNSEMSFDISIFCRQVYATCRPSPLHYTKYLTTVKRKGSLRSQFQKLTLKSNLSFFFNQMKSQRSTLTLFKEEGVILWV